MNLATGCKISRRSSAVEFGDATEGLVEDRANGTAKRRSSLSALRFRLLERVEILPAIRREVL
jgi:hypothetical protein